MNPKPLILIAIIFLMGFSEAVSAEEASTTCALALCGPARSDIDRLVVDPMIFSRLTSQLTQTVFPNVDALVELEVKSRLYAIHSLPILLKEATSQNVTKYQRAVLNLALIGAFFSNLQRDESKQFFSFDDRGFILLKKSAVLMARPELNNEQGINLLDATQAFLQNPFMHALNSVSSTWPLDIFLEFQRKFDSISDLQNLVAALQFRLASLDTQGIGLLVPASARKLLLQIATRGSIQPMESQKFIRTYVMINMLSGLGAPYLLDALSKPVLSVEQLRKTCRLDFIEKYVNTVLNSAVGLKALHDRLKKELNGAVVKFVVSGITSSERIATEEMIARLKDSAFLAIESQSSATPPIKQRANDMVVKLDFEWPLSQADNEVKVLQLLKNSEIDALDLISQIDQVSGQSGSPAVTLGSILMSINKIFDESGINLSGLIDDYDPPSLVDKAFTQNGKVQLSWQSIKNLNYGAGIIGHEMGHIVSSSINPFNSSAERSQSIQTDLPGKMCTVDHHTVSASLFDSKKPFYQAEEDWADLFSTVLLKNLVPKMKTHENFGCLLLDYNKKKNEYKNLSFLPTIEGDVHSSGFYRLLQIQKEMSFMPASCVEASRLQGDSAFFKSCIQ